MVPLLQPLQYPLRRATNPVWVGLLTALDRLQDETASLSITQRLAGYLVVVASLQDFTPPMPGTGPYAEVGAC
jgi:hypothetical protein